ncbi:MAG: bifunctional (p)ppGpp synthetase/guanosine-3',5'-bis(diphosphate) 3'-pyrophosphohydrolase [Candidatus Moranbacteria bacterium]|nr:bifunctional (p)ppGpp synthetase/guanosine-3',5'-bis(diphosphate) 3'-pyrophosphohydrolase [Candidatus Moranbacteria bacterium]
MELTDKIQRALNLAADKHNGQMRKSSGLPYIVHPFSVALILSEYVQDEDVIVAGLLHDVLEDVKDYKYEDLKKDFGQKIADIVQGVSEDKDFDNGETDRETWQERKDEYLKNLWNDSEKSLLVCAADKIHNLRSMMMIYEEQGAEMWIDFNAPVEKQTWYYGEVLKILQEKLGGEMVGELEREFERFKKTVSPK